jgi:hypothetical protein
MNREKAKIILQSYRPGGQDRDDPQFAEALALTEKDPALKQWFHEQHHFDQALSASVQSIAIPAALQSKLLTEIREVRSGAPATQAETIDWWTRLWQRAQQALSYPILDLSKAAANPPPPLWRSRPVLGIAAAFTAIVLFTLYWNNRPATFLTLCQEITEEAWSVSPHVEFESPNLSEIRVWLASHDIQTKIDLPPGLQSASVRGCNIIEWHGRKIPVVCLMEHSCHMHFLVIDDPPVTDAPAENQPALIDFGQLRTASWSNKDSSGKEERLYVLTGMNLRTFVKKFRHAGQWILSS